MEYRDDTLSWDKYEVQPIEAHKVQGTPIMDEPELIHETDGPFGVSPIEFPCFCNASRVHPSDVDSHGFILNPDDMEPPIEHDMGSIGCAYDEKE